VPDAIPFSENFVLRSVATEPSVIRLMPNNSIPRQAAKKTRFFLYMKKINVQMSFKISIAVLDKGNIQCSIIYFG
jgi:hypothetical protein